MYFEVLLGKISTKRSIFPSQNSLFSLPHCWALFDETTLSTEWITRTKNNSSNNSNSNNNSNNNWRQLTQIGETIFIASFSFPSKPASFDLSYQHCAKKRNNIEGNRVCHGFRLTNTNDYFWVNFDDFWIEHHFIMQLGQ